ncbi:SGNH/GDSL hydrolase family protein [Streptomyces sp. NPDC005336]|uniref:SGNH/GDSL hydrolase family protein n=1 Tax=Streptomyces sp. NPDC005336 TaxID=3157035 RepID=UPI0033B4F27E
MPGAAGWFPNGAIRSSVLPAPQGDPPCARPGAEYHTPRAEAKRAAINEWIRTSGAFEAVVDFAEVMAAPSDPLALDPAYDSGDFRHPNDAGYRRMAEAIDLNTL